MKKCFCFFFVCNFCHNHLGFMVELVLSNKNDRNLNKKNFLFLFFLYESSGVGHFVIFKFFYLKKKQHKKDKKKCK